MLREFLNISETLKTTIKFGLLFARRSNFLLVITLFSLFLSSILFYLGLILFGFLLQNMFAGSSVKIIPAMSFLNEFNLLYLVSITIFLALILDFLSSWLVTRACANFGARIVFDNQKIHPYKKRSEITNIFSLGKIATRLSKFLINSMVPLCIAIMGCFILGYFNLIFGIVLLVVILVSGTFFAPIHYITSKDLRKNDENNKINIQSIKATERAYLPLLRIFLNRKTISTTLNVIIFSLILSIFYFMTYEQIISFFSAELLILLAIFRASITSLSRIMMCFQFVLGNLDNVNILIMCMEGNKVTNLSSVDNQDEENL